MCHDQARCAVGVMVRVCVGWILALGVLGGCSSSLKVAPGAYRGPAIGVESSGDWYVVVAEMPSPGWALSLDSRRAVPDATRVFVTLRRPNPIAVYSTQMVTQRVITPVRTEGAIEVYARVMPFGSEDEGPYFAAVTD